MCGRTIQTNIIIHDMLINYRNFFTSIVLCLFFSLYVKAYKQDSISISGQVYNEAGILVDTVMNMSYHTGTITEIPKSIKTVGNCSFLKNKDIKYVSLPKSIETIGVRAFDGCSRLVEVNIEQDTDGVRGLKEIEYCAFFRCRRLKKITFPSTLRIIGAGAFHECSSLKSIFIPASVDSVDYWSFSGCSALESIVVDNENKYYDSRDNCNAIINTKHGYLIAGCKNTIIPKGVTAIFDNAFEGIKSFKRFIVPNGIKAVCRNVWRGCRNLKRVEFPSSIEFVDYGIFDNCNKLKSVAISRNEPPECCLLPSDVLSHATLYVPEGCVEKYQKADGWKNFGEIKELTFRISR